jgi:hypothetical protein
MRMSRGGERERNEEGSEEDRWAGVVCLMGEHKQKEGRRVGEKSVKVFDYRSG